MTLADLLQNRFGTMAPSPSLPGLDRAIYGPPGPEPQLDSEIYDTRNIAARMPAPPTGMAAWLQGLAGRVRTASRPDNMLAGGLDTASRWLDLDPHIGQDTVAPLGGALMGALGLGVLGRPDNSLGMFGGRLAATADREALARAEGMAARGAPREEIWRDTGWFQGRDGRWRFEIDDSNASLSNAATASAEYTGASRQGTIDPDLPPGLNPDYTPPAFIGDLSTGLHHPNLYAAYPLERTSPFAMRRGETTDNSAVYPMYGADRSVVNQYWIEGPNDVARRNVTLHEVQHGLQKREGFSPSRPIGREESHLMVERSRLINQQLEAERPRTIWERLFGPRRPPHVPESLIDNLTRRIEQTGRVEYRNQLAEVEARNVEARSHLDPAGRRRIPPWETEDVPPHLQIIHPPSPPDAQQILRDYYGGVP